MAINFDSFLTPDQKRSILEQRIQQFAVEAYQLELNSKVANEDGKAEAVANLAILESAINAYVEELNTLPTEVTE